MKHPVTIGVVCLARKTFDFAAAQELYTRIQQDLKKVENATFECFPGLVIEVADAQEAARALAAKLVDGLIIISGTFALGHLALELHKIVQKPILLWGLPELPYDGGKIRLNSACGVNLNASNLYKAGVRTYHAVIQDHVDEAWVDALRILAAFRTAHVGLAGFRAHGFFNLSVDDSLAFAAYGTLLDHYELQAIFDTPVDAGAVAKKKAQLERTFDLTDINADQLAKVATLAAKLDAFMTGNTLDALAIRCWPEFAATFGIAPCAAMSLLLSAGRVLACEGDVEGMLSMLAHQALGGETPFLADFSQVNFEQNTALLWHCGVAPCNLRDGVSTCSLDTYFAGGKGVTAGFVLKPGRVNILRFDTAGGKHRVFLQNARGIPMGKDLKGTFLKVTFDEPAEVVFHRIVDNGIAHHASVVYGEFSSPIEIFAKIMGWDVIQKKKD